MDFTNISKSIPIEPYIDCDGYYASCLRCHTEIEPTDSICPKCNQFIDWSWFGKDKHEK